MRTATAPRNSTARVLVFIVIADACTDPVGVVATTGSFDTILLALE